MSTTRKRKLQGLGWDDNRNVMPTSELIDKIADYLEKYNIDISQFFSTADAFFHAVQSSKEWDFLILDIIDASDKNNVDENRGFELAARCRQEMPNIPIIFLSDLPRVLVESVRVIKQPYCVFSKNYNPGSLCYEIFKFLEFCKLTQSKIFVGHGRSDAWKEVVKHIQTAYNLQCEEFDISERAGQTIAQVLETMKNESGLALLVMTAEDLQTDTTVRARQNVIHEIGFFQGHLGFSKTIIFIEKGCESFSNVTGTVYLDFEKGKIADTFERLKNVLKREHFI